MFKENPIYQDCIEGCRKKDRAAQRKMFEALAPKMFAVCLRYMGDRAAAEDILQDGFVTLYSKIDTYSGDGSFEGWARRLFVNTALMALRKKDALKMSDELDVAGNVNSEAPTQIQDIGYKELMKLVASLPAGYRTVFNMNVIEGYSHDEIAKMLNISAATSRSQLLRARAMLQNKIKKLYGSR